MAFFHNSTFQSKQPLVCLFDPFSTLIHRQTNLRQLNSHSAMSFESASFAKSLYASGTPRKQQLQQGHGSPHGSTQGQAQHAYSTPSKNMATPVFSTPNTSFSVSNISGISNNSPLAGRGPGFKAPGVHQPASTSTPEQRRDTPNFDRTFTGGNASFMSVYSSTPIKANTSSWSTPGRSTASPPQTPVSKITGTAEQGPSASSPSLSAAAALMAAGGSLPSTPNASKPPKPSSVPTGSWEHPSLAAIRSRTINKEQVLRTVFTNIIGLVIFNVILNSASAASIIPESITTELAKFSHITFYLVTALQCLFAFNITWNAYKLVKPQDTFEDLPLTPSQRKLMGLPDSPNAKVPANPASPPRYVKSSAQTRYSPLRPQANSAIGSSSPTVTGASRGTPFNSKASNVVLASTPSKNTPSKLVPESPLAGLSRKLNTPVKEQPAPLPAVAQKPAPVLPGKTPAPVPPTAPGTARPVNPSVARLAAPGSVVKPAAPGPMMKPVTPGPVAPGVSKTPVSAPVTQLPEQSPAPVSPSVSFTPSGRYRYMAESPNRHRSFHNV